MAMGPVQLLVVGFDEPSFQGEVMRELDRLRDSDVVRLVDLLVVRKDDEGNVEHVQRSDLSPGEAERLGATVGALIGIGAGGEEAAEAGAILGAIGIDEAGGHILARGGLLVRRRRDPQRPPRPRAHRAPLGDRAARRDPAAGGALLADEWVHPADLAAVGLLAAEEAAAH